MSNWRKSCGLRSAYGMVNRLANCYNAYIHNMSNEGYPSPCLHRLYIPGDCYHRIITTDTQKLLWTWWKKDLHVQDGAKKLQKNWHKHRCVTRSHTCHHKVQSLQSHSFDSNQWYQSCYEKLLNLTGRSGSTWRFKWQTFYMAYHKFNKHISTRGHEIEVQQGRPLYPIPQKCRYTRSLMY